MNVMGFVEYIVFQPLFLCLYDLSELCSAQSCHQLLYSVLALLWFYGRGKHLQLVSNMANLGRFP